MRKTINEVKWTKEGKEYFETLKISIREEPMLTSPNYSNPFLVFSFACTHTNAIILLQKNKQGHEHPIAFSSKVVRDV